MGRTHEPLPFLSVITAATRLGVSPRTVRRWLHAGLLPGQKVGTSWGVRWSLADTPEDPTPELPLRPLRQRLRQVGALLIATGNQVAGVTPARGAVFLTWRTPHGLQIVLAIGRRSATHGWAPHVLGLDLPFWLRERQVWRRVLPVLRRYERLRQWSHPRLLRVSGVATVAWEEMARLEGALTSLTSQHPGRRERQGD